MNRTCGDNYSHRWSNWLVVTTTTLLASEYDIHMNKKSKKKKTTNKITNDMRRPIEFRTIRFACKNCSSPLKGVRMHSNVRNSKPDEQYFYICVNRFLCEKKNELQK